MEKKTDIRFSYIDNSLDPQKNISLSVKDVSVEAVLNKVLPAKGMKFVKTGNTIAIQKVTIKNEQRTTIIAGTVIDEEGEPIIGANVVIKGSTIGTVTNSEGQFSLSVPAKAELEITYIGYVKQTVMAAQGLTIVLKEDVTTMEEVVVVGYGHQRRSDISGAISSISAKSFEAQPASSANSVLSGRLPGVNVRRSSGAPGTGSLIRIRGANSLLGSNDPLIVVDGNYVGGLPEAYDIESIDVLKDASATAIYGSRGANGVILVKTKRGSHDKPTLRFYSDVSVNTISQRYDLMDTYEFAEFNNRVGAYPFTDQELAAFKANGGVDWQDAVLQTGVSQNYKVVLTGGTKNVRYYVSPSYNESTGVVRNTEASGYGLSGKVDMDLSDRITAQIETSVNHGENLNPEMVYGGSKTSNPLMAAIVWSPTEPIYNQDGTYRRIGLGTGTVMNPKLMTDIKETNYSNNGSGVGNIKIKIIDGLVLDAKGAVSFATGGTRDYESKDYNGVNASAKQTSYETSTWLVNAFLTYSKVFADAHDFSAMAGWEETKSKTQSFDATARILPLESVGWYNLGLAAPNIDIASGWGNSAMRSFFGRVGYNYAYRYYLTANFRADGSSKFRDGNRFSYFPSFALAWRLSQEKFMASQSIFQDIKIRGGWGITGSQAIDNYATYSTLRGRNFYWGDVAQPGYHAQVGGNPNLKWEQTKQLNLGFDLTTLDNRFILTVDYYNKKTVDLLAPVAVPAYNGGNSEYGNSSVISNVGSVRNEGFELNINYDVFQSKDWAYNVNLNGAINRNKVLDIGENNMIYGQNYAGGFSATSPFVLMSGQPIGTIYGLKYLGIWQENEAAEAAKYQQAPGDYKYEDLNGNYNYDAEDHQVIGKTNPKFTWGVNNHLSYKNFDLNVLFEGVHGRDILNWSYLVASERIDFSQTYTLRDAKNRWTPDNPGAKFAKIGNTNRLSALSSQYMQNGSYVKLRNLSLAYRIPKRIVPFANIKLSVSAQNILTFTKYKGYDPEISSRSTDSDSGMDWFAYPNPKSFSFGLSIEY